MQGPQGVQGLQGVQGPTGATGFGDTGSFWDETTQGDDGPGGFVANTAYAMTFDHADPDAAHGVTVSNGSHITFSNPGVYNIQFSAQIERSQGGNVSRVSIWLAKNGVAVPATSTDISLASTAVRLVAAWNFFVSVSCAPTCDYYELMWSAESEFTALLYQPPQTLPDRPAIPSIILTVNQVR